MRSFKEAVEVRKDETYHRISSTFENLEAPGVVWHGKSFQSYTSKRNLSFIKPLPFAESQERHDDRPVQDRKLMQWIGPFVYFAAQKVKGDNKTYKLFNI